MNRHLLTRRVVPALVVALSLGASGTANASTAQVDAESGQLTITGAPGENNIVTASRVQPDDIRTGDNTPVHVYLVHDSSGEKPSDYPTNFPKTPVAIPLIAGAGCTPVSTTTVRCTGSFTQDGKITSIKADLNDGFDYFSPSDPRDPLIAPITALGGVSDDFLKGGSSNDTLDGGVGDETLQGFGGDDVLKPGLGANDLYGSDRNLRLDAGGASDTIDYSSVAVSTNANGAFVTPDGSADDGINCFHELGNPAPTQCDNVNSDIENVIGTDGRDIILMQAGDVVNTVDGRGGNDRIDTFGGADVINGGDGTNVINAGAGNDTIKATNRSGINGAEATSTGNNTVDAGDGDDTVTLGDGQNTVNAGAGVDTVTVGNGGNTVDGQAGVDTLTAGNGNDTVGGGDGNDTITTTGGNDTIDGSAGNDVITAGAGDDFVRGGLGADTNMDGGAGIDTLSYDEKTEPVFASLNETNAFSGTYCGDRGTPTQCEGDTIVAGTFENLQGGSAGDHLIGSDAAANRIDGNGGDDLLKGLTRDDVLFGGAGDDTLVGGLGADAIHGGTGEGDFVSYELSTVAVGVTLDGTKNDGEHCQPGSTSTCEGDNLFPDVENIRGGGGNDYLVGADPNNDQSISGNNTLEGMIGNDTLDGKLGSDVIRGGVGTDTVLYGGRTENLRVTLDGVRDDGTSTDPSSAAASTELDQVDADVENVTSGSGSDVIIGSAANNGLLGNAGNDRITGLGGDDTVNGGAGEDILDGGFGADDLIGGADNDWVEYTGRGGDTFVVVTLDDARNDGQADAAGASQELDNVRADVENLRGGDERDFFEGSFVANTLDGGAGDDILSGAAGADTLRGGAGGDVLHGDAGDDLLDGGLGADDIHGQGGFDTADYSSRTNPITVTFDEVANDGEAGENDNVRRSVEDYKPNTTPPVTPTPVTPTPDPEPGVTLPTTDGTTTGSSTGTETTKVDATTETKDTTAKQGSATFASAKQISSRKVLVRGKILVKARNGLAQSSAACKGGGKVRVTLTKAGKVVGKKVVKLSRTCSFRAPVTLAKGTTGKLKVEVRFLGNGALKASKRTTNLQVNG